MGKLSTSMRGSSEGHAVYVYRRTSKPKPAIAVDGIFTEGVKLLEGDRQQYQKWIDDAIDSHLNSGRTPRKTRASRGSEKDAPASPAKKSRGSTKAITSYFPAKTSAAASAADKKGKK